MNAQNSLNEFLERLRYVIFIGNEPSSSNFRKTQEQYVFAYEQRLERDPATERKLIEKYSASLLPIYKKQREQSDKLEQLFSGNESAPTFDDEDMLEELYDEIANLETEFEWKDFKNRFLEGQS